MICAVLAGVYSMYVSYMCVQSLCVFGVNAHTSLIFISFVKWAHCKTYKSKEGEEEGG